MLPASDCIERGQTKFAAARSLNELQRAMAGLITEAGFAHASYYLPPWPLRPEADPILLLTYPQAWIDRYVESKYFQIDPVLTQCMGGILPTDWAMLDRRAPKVRAFFVEAKEYGLGSQGLTIAIRGPSLETAIFSVTSNASDRDWREMSRTMTAPLQLIGHMIHERVMALCARRAENTPPRLSPRELDCLRYCAMGLRDREASDAMGISEAVARSYLDSARRKLHAATRPNAVARAIELGIISAGPSEPIPRIRRITPGWLAAILRPSVGGADDDRLFPGKGTRSLS